MKRYILIALCALALAYTAKIAFGVVDMARYQEVPIAASVFEFIVLIAAALIPLAASLRRNKEKKAWHYFLWTPCILYVVAITINYLIRIPASTASYSTGMLRLSIWLAIAFLFIREFPRKKTA